MRLELRQLAPWVFGQGQLRRYTQDSPVMPDVWMAYGDADRDDRLDLLLEPHREAGAAVSRLSWSASASEAAPASRWGSSRRSRRSSRSASP